MPNFFEPDPDEIYVRDKVYVDFFNLYPNLTFDSTLAHLHRLSETEVIYYSESPDGWQIEVDFFGVTFLLDTHFHGTSTLFCTKKSVVDDIKKLAFLGCFLPLFCDDRK